MKQWTMTYLEKETILFTRKDIREMLNQHSINIDTIGFNSMMDELYR